MKCSTYNIPVCVWLYQTHPQSRCPSVPMVINPRCPYVEASKQVLLDCLVTWKSISDATYCSTFQSTCGVFRRWQLASTKQLYPKSHKLLNVTYTTS
ncbi:uncharacterized protein ACWYII_041972 isoform 3-T3 [Salvelinus alpinus]